MKKKANPGTSGRERRGSYADITKSAEMVGAGGKTLQVKLRRGVGVVFGGGGGGGGGGGDWTTLRVCLTKTAYTEGTGRGRRKSDLLTGGLKKSGDSSN